MQDRTSCWFVMQVSAVCCSMVNVGVVLSKLVRFGAI